MFFLGNVLSYCCTFLTCNHLFVQITIIYTNTLSKIHSDHWWKYSKTEFANCVLTTLYSIVNCVLTTLYSNMLICCCYAISNAWTRSLPFNILIALYYSSIQNLSLRHCGITDKGAEQIGQALGSTKRCNTKLISLNLSGNRITDVGAEHIALVSYCWRVRC